MSAPVNRAMLLGDAEIPSPAELDRYAESGVRAFLAGLRPAGSPRPTSWRDALAVRCRRCP